MRSTTRRRLAKPTSPPAENGVGSTEYTPVNIGLSGYRVIGSSGHRVIGGLAAFLPPDRATLRVSSGRRLPGPRFRVRRSEAGVAWQDRQSPDRPPATLELRRPRARTTFDPPASHHRAAARTAVALLQTRGTRRGARSLPSAHLQGSWRERRAPARRSGCGASGGGWVVP